MKVLSLYSFETMAMTWTENVELSDQWDNFHPGAMWQDMSYDGNPSRRLNAVLRLLSSDRLL